MQNFKTFRTNFTTKVGPIDVGSLRLQFRSVKRSIEVRIDSPFWDFGITVTCLRRVGVDWLGGTWAMLCGARLEAAGRLQPIQRLLRLRNTVLSGEPGMRNTTILTTITIIVHKTYMLPDLSSGLNSVCDNNFHRPTITIVNSLHNGDI